MHGDEQHGEVILFENIVCKEVVAEAVRGENHDLRNKSTGARSEREPCRPKRRPKQKPVNARRLSAP